MAKSKLYRMPLSIIDEKEMEMSKVCAGCSMRHILDVKDELVELDGEGNELTSYHVNCAPAHAVATPMQFIRSGYDRETAEKLAEKANNRFFKLRQEDQSKSETESVEIDPLEVS